MRIALLSPGMEAVMNGIQPLLFQMRINLGGGNIGMPQHFLNDAEVGAVLQQMRGEGMPEDMREDMLFYSRGPGAFPENLAYPFPGQRPSAHRQENMAIISAAGC